MKIRPQAPMGALIDRQALSFAWRYMLPYRKRLAFHAVGASGQSLLVLPVLALVRRAFDVSIPAGDVGGLILIGAAIFLLRGVSSLVSLGLRSHALRVVKGAITTLRMDVVAALIARSRSDLDAIDPADTQTRLVQDTERSDRVLNTILSAILPSLITFTALTLVLLVLDWRLVILGFLVVPVLWFASRAMGRVVEREMRVFQRRFERFSKGVHFVLRQMDLVRLTGAEAMELTRQRRALEELRDSGHQMAMTFAVHSQLQRTLTGLAGIALLVGGGIGVALGTLTLGEFITFYVAAGMLSGSVNSILGGLPEIVVGNVSLLTLRELLEDAEREPYTGRDPIRFDGRIEFRHVYFGYGDA
jgi:ABC-type multidrug transport system fused ATPase/permease subunit